MMNRDTMKDSPPSETPPRSDRRGLLLTAAAAVGSFAVIEAFHGLAGRSTCRAAERAGLGPLEPVRDEKTGIELLKLPKGFRYVSFGWTGDKLDDGTATPGAHDGMGVIASTGSQITLCRNHEISQGWLFGHAGAAFDKLAGGGCTNLVFDTREGSLQNSWTSLVGTLRNCAGGPTPWGTWLSCEETVLGPRDLLGLGLEREHGWIFEVPSKGTAEPIPLKEMGRFVHEAVAVDPDTSIVYQTEDRKKAGFYRFVPNTPGKLINGGQLQMMKVVGHSDLSKYVKHRQTFKSIEWVDIDQPTLAHSEGTKDEHGVFGQGKRQGATTFARLEGCWQGNNRIYFVSTSGGRSRSGQIWEFDPRIQQLRLVFESPGSDVLDKPDNIAVSPRGGIVLCEDGDTKPQRMHGLTPDGNLFTLAENNVVLRGEKNRIRGDYRAEEWAGATFSPDGTWLFVNVQKPGITFAITGPWADASL